MESHDIKVTVTAPKSAASKVKTAMLFPSLHGKDTLLIDLDKQA
jgi:hypothetical protein